MLPFYFLFDTNKADFVLERNLVIFLFSKIGRQTKPWSSSRALNVFKPRKINREIFIFADWICFKVCLVFQHWKLSEETAVFLRQDSSAKVIFKFYFRVIMNFYCNLCLVQIIQKWPKTPHEAKLNPSLPLTSSLLSSAKQDDQWYCKLLTAKRLLLGLKRGTPRGHVHQRWSNLDRISM